MYCNSSAYPQQTFNLENIKGQMKKALGGVIDHPLFPSHSQVTKHAREWEGLQTHA